jgi:beta-galactosidase
VIICLEKSARARLAAEACCVVVRRLSVLFLLLFLCSVHAAERLTFNFNPDWKFIRADEAGAAEQRFDDSKWLRVSTPHTFNDTDTFDDWSLLGHRGEQNQWGGRTWYRKTFTLPKSYQGKKVFIEFEAVRQVAEVYLNGKYLGISKTGFTPFGFDLTPHLKFNGPNVLALMCDNRFARDPLNGEGVANPDGRGENGGPSLSQLSARANAAIPEEVSQLAANQIPWNNPHWHPAHGGIYRNVYLHVTDPLHISLPLHSFLQTAGPYAYTKEISPNAAHVGLEIPFQNERAESAIVEVKAQVYDNEGKLVLSLKESREIAAGVKTQVNLSGVIPGPKLWEPNYPHLYRVVCSLQVKGKTVDTCEIPLGIRQADWDTQSGFFINGHHLKLRGWGQKPTDEWPGLGAAQPDWLHFFTLDMMKEAGGNFVRWGHCAGGPASVAAADKLGIITDQPGVDGESDTRGAAWKVRVEAFRDTVIYYRNNPSILIWEGGNQKVTAEHGKELSDIVKQYDPHGGRAYAHRRADKKTAEFMDVGIGTEGGREIASLPVVEGEYNREESPRRVWDNFSPPGFGYPEGKGQTYHLTSEEYAVNQVAQFVRKVGTPEHSGGANWIFSDSTSGGRVACEVARTSGEVDGVRLPKEAYYVCQAMFRADPQVHIIGHWNYPAGTGKNIYVVSNGDAVELFVNGKSLGHGVQSDRYLFTFKDVAWEPGEVKAVAYNGGRNFASAVKRTAGPAVSLRVTPVTGPDGLQADGSDVVLFDVEAVDSRGERCPTFQDRVDFELKGPATWRGGYNSGKTNSINHAFLDLECGINRVAVRATRKGGSITLRARARNLKSGTATIRSRAVKVEGGLGKMLPGLPEDDLPEKRTTEFTTLHPVPKRQGMEAVNIQVGRFTKAFSYSGPTAIVHVEQNAQPNKNVYVDRDFGMGDLPSQLVGADWVQAANSDSSYWAVDLMEITVAGGTTVFVAHDDRLPRPSWLVKMFSATSTQITVNGHTKTIFQRQIERDESLTLGPNVDDSKVKSGNMYVVFVSSSKAEVKQAKSAGQVQN